MKQREIVQIKCFNPQRARSNEHYQYEPGKNKHSPSWSILTSAKNISMLTCRLFVSLFYYNESSLKKAGIGQFALTDVKVAVVFDTKDLRLESSSNTWGWDENHKELW